MLRISRISFGAALAALTLLVFAPAPASAAFWPGFPWAPPPSNTVVELPAPNPFNLCVKTLTVAGKTIHVPQPCPKDTTPPPPPTPTLVFTATPETIDEGDSSLLQWDSTNADSCTASGGWSGAKSADGSQSVSPSATTNYVLTCTGAGGNIIEDVTVTVTPAPEAPTLTLVKVVVNDNGGTADEDDFQAKIDGSDVPWASAQTVAVGSHTASETSVAGYSASSWGGDCAADGTVTLAAGEDKTCTITNNDQAGTLRVVKVVTNDNNGTKTAADFEFKVNDGTATAFEADGQNDIVVNAGTYSVVEVAEDGYTPTYENCTNVAVSNGETETCTVTNNDVVPAPTTATLTLVKVVVNNNGGAALVTDWTLVGDGPTDISGTSGSAAVTNAVVDPGEYALAETGGPTGYTASQYSCVKNGGDPASVNAITLAAGDTATCTITNDDQQGYIVVSKQLINNNGGTGTTTDFAFTIDGGDPIFFTDFQMVIPVDAGTHTVVEVATSTYTTTYEDGDGNLECNDLVVKNGNPPQPLPDVASCLITNNDNEPQVEGALLITEVLYDIDTATQGAETNDEWVEIHNGTNAEIDVSGYALKDNQGTVGDVFPEGTTIPAGGFLVVVASSTTAGFWNIPAEADVLVVDGDIGGNGLANAGDHLTLHDTADTVVDAVSWGSDITAFDPSVAVVAEGHSSARTPQTTDTNTAADWADDDTPNPGE